MGWSVKDADTFKAYMEHCLQFSWEDAASDKIVQRRKELHPSSFPYCGLMDLIIKLQKGEDPNNKGEYYGDYYTGLGTFKHELMQRYTGWGGRMIGDWKCGKCGNETKFEYYHRCKKCDSPDNHYQELEIKAGKHTIGHTDGLVLLKGKYWVIDYKGLALDTPIPTIRGWKTMGELKVGDTIFDSKGNKCKITHKSDIHKRKCYKVIFDDGSSVVCDDEHLWVTYFGRRKEKGVVNTEQIKATLRDNRGQAQHRIPIAGALQLNEKSLPAHPYVLGCWLGDGIADRAVITKPDVELFANIESFGYKIGKNVEKRANHCQSLVIEGLLEELKEINVLKNKHIPTKYLRASYQQRLDLLQGIFDTDGSWNKIRRRAVMNTVDEKFAYQVQELLFTLGQKPSLQPYIAKGFGKEVPAYFVEFTPINGLQPFKLPRKANLVETKTVLAKASQRVIVDVLPIKPVKTQCIAVDSPDRTYLCTKNMITTHNTTSSKALWWHKKNTADGKQSTMPYKKNVSQIRSYVPLLEKNFGIKVAGWMLIYVSRDSSFRDYEVIAYEMTEKEKKEEWQSIVRMDKHFGIAQETYTKKNLKLAIPLVQEKPCNSYKEYKEKFLGDWDKEKCPLGDTKACFDPDELRKMVKDAMTKYKNGEVEPIKKLKELKIRHPQLEAKAKREARNAKKNKQQCKSRAINRRTKK